MKKIVMETVVGHKKCGYTELKQMFQLSAQGETPEDHLQLWTHHYLNPIDLLVWRKKVATWVDLITTAASKGPDRTYKSLAATLAHHLYDRALRQVQKSLVDEAQALGKINFKQKDQIRAVQEIVDLVAVDPPIAVVTRLIDSFNKVTSCKKKNNEDLNRFLSRYRGLASEHLMKGGATFSSPVGEVLAINLLQNANLPDSTLTNAKINLIQLAKSRKKEIGEDPYQVSAPNVQSIMDGIKELRELQESISDEAQQSVKDTADIIVSVLPVLEDVIKKLEDPYKELERSSFFRREESVTRSITTTGPRYVLSLEDAVTVLRSLAQTVKSEPPQKSDVEEIQTAVRKQIQSFFGTMDYKERPRNDQDRRNGWKRERQNGTSKEKFEPSRKRFRKENHSKDNGRKPLIDDDCCKDCGSSEHIRGDLKCDNPSFFTMKIREAKKAQDQERKNKDDDYDKDESNKKGNFRPDSKRTRGKRV